MASCLVRFWRLAAEQNAITRSHREPCSVHRLTGDAPSNAHRRWDGGRHRGRRPDTDGPLGWDARCSPQAVNRPPEANRAGQRGRGRSLMAARHAPPELQAPCCR